MPNKQKSLNFDSGFFTWEKQRVPRQKRLDITKSNVMLINGILYNK